MNKLSRRSILLFLAYVVAAIVMTVVMLRKADTEDGGPQPPKHEAGKPADKLAPSELFFFDRNYPAAEPAKDVFRSKLKSAIAYDQKMAVQQRGLDHPWTIQGPGNIGGRVNTIAVHPTDPDIILIGFSQGGIYRTSDGGETWIPVFDEQASLAISHIIYSPHDDSHVWATTGDVNISGYPFIGSGIYHSTDGGQTWINKGLEQKGVLSKVFVDPSVPDIIYAGSMGFPSHKGDERGFFRSLDNGDSWEKTLHVDDSTGIIDLVVDPVVSGRLFASAWTRLRSSRTSALIGPGTSLYKSDDYGSTWVNLTNGLPDGDHSRTSVEITNDGTLFISYIGEVTKGECSGFIESLQGIYKSIDGGSSWDTIPLSFANNYYCELFGQFGWYFEALKVNPANPQDMFLLGVDIMRTLDGGLYWFPAAPAWWTYEVHADKHDLVFAHGHMYLGTDGGAYMTDINQANDWWDIENIPATQFYRTVFNPHLPDQYVGGAQDNGTTGGNETLFNEWSRLFGGDGFQPLFDPEEPDWRYVLVQNGVPYYSLDNGFNFEKLTNGLEGTRYWDMPFVISPHDPKILFCGSNSVYRIDMRDTAREWKVISPDLTRGENILGNRYPAITAIAQSELDASRIYAGTQDGLLWTTGDGGLNWTNITEGTPGFYVTSITCSTVDPRTVIATYSGYRDNDHQPYIYKSDDAGSTWTSIQSALPMMGVNSFYILPGWNDDILLAGTDGGVYVSMDAGVEWERVGSGMPYMPVYDLDFNPVQNTIVAATFGRGIMTFPVEELDIVSSIASNAEAAEALILTIYPTLTSDVLNIICHQQQYLSAAAQFSVTDMIGNVVQQGRAFLDFENRIDLVENLMPGLYLISFSIGSQTITEKFLVQ